MVTGPFRNDFVRFLLVKLNDEGCWSDFNAKYRYYTFLVALSKMSPLLVESDLPPAPTPTENDTLDC